MDPVTASFVIAGINTGIGLLTNRKSGMQKEEASRIVDSVEVELKRIVATWENIEPKTIEAKNTFLKSVLDNFDKTKYFLQNPSLGDYGIKAITERFGTYDPITGDGVRGTGGNGWTDWWSYYWFPIYDDGVNQPTGQIGNNSNGEGWVATNTGSGTSGNFDRSGFTQSGYAASGSGGNSQMLLLIGAGLVLFLMMKGK